MATPENPAAEKIRLLKALWDELTALRTRLEGLLALSPGEKDDELVAGVAGHIEAIEKIRVQIDKLEKRAPTCKETSPVNGDAGGLEPPFLEDARAAETEIAGLLRQIDDIHRQNIALAEKFQRQMAAVLKEIHKAAQIKAYLKSGGACGGWFIDRRR